MPDGSKSARSDLIGGVGWVVFGLLIGAAALRMDRFTQMGATLYTMPGFMPGLISVTLMLLGLVLCLRGWRRRRSSTSAEDTPRPPLLSARVLTTLILALIYAAGLIGRMHFMLATTLFVTLSVWIFTPQPVTPMRRAITALIIGLTTAVVVFFVFEKLFLVRLP